MLDYQRIVDEVRNSLFSNGAEGADFLRTAAADYSVAVDEVNDRLRHCGTLLKQGLRSEAIQLAEIEPNLLDLVATLDFPERSHWIDVLTLNGIVAPRPLMLDVAADLNEAYAIEQPLADLLRQHRLLALSRGPLNRRVDTLRSLAQSDGNNPVWREDLSVFEKERQKQLQQEVADAAKAGDLATITALDNELRSEGWLELPPRELVRYSADVRHRFEHQHTRAELADAVVHLNDCYAAFDVDTGRQWREAFQRIGAEANLPPGDELTERAAPALAWLAEQDEIAEVQSQHDAAVARLEAGLRGSPTRGELIGLHNKARANGFALSDRLVQAVKDRIAAMDRAATLKRRAWIAGISAAVLAIAALVTIVVLQTLHRSEVARQADSLARLLDAGDLAAAQAQLDQLKQFSPSVAASDEVQRLAGQLHETVRKEAERHDAFEADLKRASAAGPADPDYDALSEATKLATTAGEKDALKQFKDAIAAAEQARIAANDGKLSALLDGFESRLKKLEAGPNDDLAAALDQITQLRSEFKAAEQGIGSTSGAAHSRVGPMTTRLDAIEAALRRRGGEESQLELITKEVGDADRYQEALAGYVRQFPDSPRSADFKAALEDTPIWLGLAKWNEALALFNKQNLGTLSPDAAKSLLAAGNQILKDYANYPSAEALRRLLPYLDAVGHRVETQNERITESLTRLFKDPLMADVWMMELVRKDRRERFYLKQKPELEQEPIQVLYIAGFDMAEKHIPRGVRAGEPTSLDRAPQLELAKAIREQLDQLSDANWDRTFFHIVQTILADKPPIDPILKFNLLKQTLDVGCRGSRVFAQAFAPQQTAIQGATIDPTANWLEPNDRVAEKNRASADDLFRAFPDINAAGKAAAEDLAELEKPVGTPLRWVGWLRRGGAGAWRCNPDRLGSENGDLFIAIKQVGGGASLLRVGTLKQGIPEIAADSSQSYAEGRPVYLKLK